MTQDHEPTVPGERLVTQFTPEQRGWLVVALVAFFGVVVIGPAITSAAEASRKAGRQASKKIRRLGGGAIDRVTAGVDRLHR